MASSQQADIELGQCNDSYFASYRLNRGFEAIRMNRSRAWPLSWIKKPPRGNRKRENFGRQPMQSKTWHNFKLSGSNCWLVLVEDYPRGYARFSALIASHVSFHLCRRFSNLRARLLLLKQDRLSLLEKRLEKIDRDEANVLFLGSSRRDSNSERRSVLSEIDAALSDYGMHVCSWFK
jgi:hypothetical protein